MRRKMKDSDVEWIGKIPESWEVVSLKRNYRIISGATPKSDNIENWDGEIAWITPSDYKSEDKYVSSGKKSITKKGYNSCSTTMVPANSIVFSKRAPVGTVAISANDLCTNQGCLSCVPINEANAVFGYYSMLSGKHAFEMAAQGTTFMEISAYAFANTKLPYCNATEQRQTVHFLDRKCTAIDTAIEKTKKSIEKLEEYKKAVITKAVTKGIDPNAKMKDSGVEWIGVIPEGWDVKQLRTYFSRRINKNTHLQENNLLSLSYGRIIRKNIDTKEGLLPESFDGYNIVEDGDIVIRGTDLQNDHRSLRTGLVTERGIITSAYITLRPKEDVNSTYYHYLLHCYDILKVFYGMGGGLRQSLDYWEFIRMPILHPTDREQEEIISYIKTKCTAIDTAIEKKKKAIEKWEEYKKSLIYYAVTGKIDCRNEVIE